MGQIPHDFPIMGFRDTYYPGLNKIKLIRQKLNDILTIANFYLFFFWEEVPILKKEMKVSVVGVANHLKHLRHKIRREHLIQRYYYFLSLN